MHNTIDKLSEREKEVLALIADGNTNKEVGTLLGITKYTVETHRKHIKKKLQAKHTADLFRIAYLNDLL